MLHSHLFFRKCKEKASPFVMAFTDTFYQRNKIIKEVVLDTFTENITSLILINLIILCSFNNEKLSWTQQHTKINWGLKKNFRQIRNILIVTIANSYGQKVLFKTCNGFLFRVTCWIRQIILTFQQSIWNHC